VPVGSEGEADKHGGCLTLLDSGQVLCVAFVTSTKAEEPNGQEGKISTVSDCGGATPIVSIYPSANLQGRRGFFQVVVTDGNKGGLRWLGIKNNNAYRTTHPTRIFQRVCSGRCAGYERAFLQQVDRNT